MTNRRDLEFEVAAAARQAAPPWWRNVLLTARQPAADSPVIDIRSPPALEPAYATRELVRALDVLADQDRNNGSGWVQARFQITGQNPVEFTSEYQLGESSPSVRFESLFRLDPRPRTAIESEFVGLFPAGSFHLLTARAAAECELDPGNAGVLVYQGLPERGLMSFLFDFFENSLPALREYSPDYCTQFPDKSRYFRLGRRHSAILCLDPDRGGALIGLEYPGNSEFFINSNLEALARCHVCFVNRELCAVEVSQRIREIDPAAFSHEHSVWSAEVDTLLIEEAQP